MSFNSLLEIERAIDELPPQQLAELYQWLDHHRSVHMTRTSADVFEQGLGLFGSPEDAALLDEVVLMAYEERKRPNEPTTVF